MKYIKKIFLLFIIISIYSCANVGRYNQKNKIEREYFNSKGFALIYEDSFYIDKTINKKINNEDYVVLHSFLKKNTQVRIINPDNSKFIDTKIKVNSIYPVIFSAVISKKIADDLELNINNPYIEIQEIKINKKFIAKESNTYDEERKVAENAPVTEITMNNLSTDNNETKNISKKFVFFIIISDFYYHATANELRNDLENKTKLPNIFVKKINNNKYRLLAGPFKNFNALKSSYISLNNLGFEGLNIFRE